MEVENRRLYCPLRWLYLSLFLRSVSATTTDPTCSCRDYGSCEFTNFHDSIPNQQNVAVGKTAKMSSVYNSTKYNMTSGPACLAVNGKPGMNFRPINLFPDNPNCIHTGDDDYEPYWEVDLGQRYSINSIRIFWISYRINERSAGVKVTVDGQQCHTFQSPVSNPSYIACSTHLAGRTVRLYKYDDMTVQDYSISVCEVEVWESYSSDPTEEARTPTTVAVATTSSESSNITKLVFPLTGSVLAGFVLIGIIIAAVWWVSRSRDRRLGLAAATRGADSMAVGVGDNIAIQCMPAPAVQRSGNALRLCQKGLREIETEDYLTPMYDKRVMSSELSENEVYEELE